MATHRCQGSSGLPIPSAKSATSYPSDVRLFSGRSGGVHSRGVVLPLRPSGAARSAGLALLLEPGDGGIGFAVTSALGDFADAGAGVGGGAEGVEDFEELGCEPAHGVDLVGGGVDVLG